MQTFPIRRSRWGLLFLVPRSPERRQATIDGRRLALRMGILGRADVPIDQVSLNFAKIQVEYRPQRSDGTLDAPVTFAWPTGKGP